MAYSPDGKHILSGGGKPMQHPKSKDEAELVLWEARTGREVRRFAGLRGSVHAVAFSPDGKTIAAGVGYYGAPVQVQGRVMLWATDSGTLLMDKGDELLNPLSLAFSPDGRLLAAGWGSTTPTMWAVASSSGTGPPGPNPSRRGPAWGRHQRRFQPR